MAAELRWILLGLSALLLIGIWWWGARRTPKTPGNAHLRETSAGPSSMGRTIVAPAAEHDTGDAGDAESRQWGVPPFEPLSIRTADFDQGQAPDLSMSATAAPIDEALNMDYAEHDIAAHSQSVAADPATPPAALESATASASVSVSALEPAPAPAVAATPSARETQRIITIRVCAVGDAHWRGADLLTALEDHGLGYGRHKVFHRKYHDGRTLFCAASLVEPGTFDIARMRDELFRGLTLFAVLPGPADALETIDTLIVTAVDLADTLHGAVQDANGAPLSAQRAEALREDVVRFQQSLSTL